MEKKLKKELRFSKSLGKLLIDNSLKENDDDFLLVSVNSYYKLEQTPTPDLFFVKTDILVFDRKISSEYDPTEEIEDYDEEDEDDSEDEESRIRKQILSFTQGLKRKKVLDVCRWRKERFREDLDEVRRVRLLELHSQLLNIELQPRERSMCSMRRRLADPKGEIEN